ECQLLQLRPGAFDAPPLPFGFWVWGVSEASDLLPLFNKKQIRFFKPQKSACTPWCVWLCSKSCWSMAVAKTPIF
ncbi:hypothetical protein, partial [Klebsiella pneumoniae]|uniref:hypothetical protein n=1 Tax=Klebsiella pneumoniae TaxID=573 RepID=UPI0019D17E70